MNQTICMNCGSPLDREGAPCAACGFSSEQADTPKIQTLLTAAFALLRESQFEEAKGAFEDVLRQDCTTASAYWGRLCARYHLTYITAADGRSVPRCTTRSGANLAKDIDYRTAMAYADDKFRAFLSEQEKALKALCSAVSSSSKNITHQFTMGEVDPNDGVQGKLKNPRYTLKLKKNKDGTQYVAGIKTGKNFKGQVVIPDGVTSIGAFAFSGCKNLTSITVGDSVTSIGNYAFFDCTALTVITLPFVGNTVSGTGNTHFGYIFGASNSSENSKYIPSSLKTVVITGGSSIGNEAFSGCSGLTSIVIPDSVTSIGTNMFSGCTSLTSITLPFIGATAKRTSNMRIGYIFGANLSSPNSEHVPSSLKTVVITSGSIIGSYAFEGCTGLTNIVLPNGLTSIGNFAFSGCTGLKRIAIPDSVTTIGVESFSGCTGLTSIALPQGVTSIGIEAFYGCTGLKGIALPRSVTTIGAEAFRGCSSLTSLFIPNSVTRMGVEVFKDCPRLTNVTLPFVGATANGTNDTHFGYIFGAYSSSCNSEYVPSSLKTVVITGGSSIGYEAFRGCTSLTKITLPDTVTSIGWYAFSGCTDLPGILIPDGVTSIGWYAFSDCTGLKNIVIPDGVTSIGNSAFEGCTGLTSLTIPDSITSIGNSAFHRCSTLTSIQFGGTKAQWSAISFGSDRNQNTGEYTVTCTDGTFSKKEA